MKFQTNMNTKKEEFLLEHKFKKVWNTDKSGSWWEKKFKLGEFDAMFYYDGMFCTMDIKIIVEPVGLRDVRLYETIWSGDWKTFKKKVIKYTTL